MTRILFAALAGLFGAAIGWIAFAAITLTVAHVTGAVDTDGGLAMSAIFGIGPVGGLIGFLAGSVLWLRRDRRAETGSALARLPLVAIAAALLIAGVAAGFWYARPLTYSSSMPPELVFEIRLPAGAPALPLVSHSDALARRSPIELRTSQNTMSAEITSSASGGDGRMIATGLVELHYRVAERTLALRHPPGSPDVLFKVQLGRSPSPTAAFSPWARDSGDRGYEIRYRVQQP